MNKMKTTVLMMLTLVLFACSTEDNEVAVGKRTTMQVNEEYNAGTIVKGEEIRAIFTVKNTGDSPLVISDVRPSCSCTVADKPKKPIAPGQSTEIVAKVSTDNATPGKEIKKTVTLMTNTKDSPKVLFIKAKIK